MTTATLIPLFLLLLPIIGCLAIATGAPAKRTALIVTLLNLFLSLLLAVEFSCTFSDITKPFQFETFFQCLQLWNAESDVAYFSINFHLGVDGINLALVLLTTFISSSAIGICSEQITRGRQFFICLLLISFGALGAFLSLDLFFAYIFHEVALIPTFILIGVWGSKDRQYNAWLMTLYLGAASLVLLAGLIAFTYYMPPQIQSLDLAQLYKWSNPDLLSGAMPLMRNIIPAANQPALFLLFLAGFGGLVSLWPFHSWAAPGYASAPPPLAMLHAGVLKKFGLYGLLRIAVPFLPYGIEKYTHLFLALLLCNILYVGLVTLTQKDLGRMLGFSSVMHMGYLFLGVASLGLASYILPSFAPTITPSLSGSGLVLLMVSHGLSIALLFGLSTEIRKRAGTLEMSNLGGLASSFPTLCFFFMIGAFASIGLPGLANFTGELLIFLGAWHKYPLATILALWGVVLSAVYMLRAVRSIFFGTISKSLENGMGDLQNWPQRWPYWLLIFPLVALGVYPQILLNWIQPALQLLLLLPKAGYPG